MKKVVLLIFNCVFAITVIMAQDQDQDQEKVGDKFKISFGLNGGYVQNINAYKLTEDQHGFTYYSINPHYSIGFDAGLFVTNKIRTRLEYRFVQFKYGMNWSNDYPLFDKTVTTVNNMDLNLHFDYTLFSNKHFHFMASPAFIYEHALKYKYKNTLADGSSNTKNYNVLSQQYPVNIAGANMSIIAKYKINENVGITLTPGYTYFLRNFVLANDKPYSRINVNLGLEFLIF